MLNVSRTTVREAIQRLAALGYVEVRRGRNGGAFVLQGCGPGRGRDDPAHAAARMGPLRAAVRLPPADRAADRPDGGRAPHRRGRGPRSATTLDAYRDAGTDREASRAADEALHAAIAHATQNPYLANLSAIDPQRDQPRLRRRAVQRADPRARASSTTQSLADAVVDGDADAAADVARSHFALTETVLRELRKTIDDERPEVGDVSARGRFVARRLLLADPGAARHERCSSS